MNFRITNTVKCLPPQNKPESIEVKNCQQFLNSEINAMKNLKIILSIGLVAHKSLINIFQKKLSDFKFKHMAIHKINKNLILVNSYHCSRYNIRTKKLSVQDFEKVFELIKKRIS